jgi:5-(carboxyamino)imidazole ribonucleotide synthase
MLKPGATIGILGGGQLGRMLAVAAAQLGYRTQVLAPDEESVAAQTASSLTRADYHNKVVLADFVAACDVVTYEFENVDVTPVEWLAERLPVHPAPAALRVAQDRIAEKSFVEKVGGRPAPWAEVNCAADLTAALDRIGCPAILKTTRFGYDGKGQALIRDIADAPAAFEAIGGPAVLEGFIHFSHEFSILIASRAGRPGGPLRPPA